MTDRPLPHILQKIRATKDREIETLLAAQSLAELERSAAARLLSDPPRGFEAAVRKVGQTPNVIAEVKKASPSKGIIRADFNPGKIASAYARGGAAALSCLTDETYFQGKLEYVRVVRETSGLPVLRKDFLVHEAQIFEACAAGADAVLLIARMLDEDELRRLYRLAKSLSLGVLVEVHDEPDIEKTLNINSTLIGINNRDLDTFVVDFEAGFRLREKIPTDLPVVSESGIGEHAQMTRLSEAGFAAVLVGESLMRQDDVEAALRALRG
jgi:indole-3-glycerol phosphate synthase